MLVLADFLDLPHIEPSQIRLCRLLGMAERTLRRVLRSLEDSGWLETKHRYNVSAKELRGEPRRNRYDLTEKALVLLGLGDGAANVADAPEAAPANLAAQSSVKLAAAAPVNVADNSEQEIREQEDQDHEEGDESLSLRPAVGGEGAGDNLPTSSRAAASSRAAPALSPRIIKRRRGSDALTHADVATLHEAWTATFLTHFGRDGAALCSRRDANRVVMVLGLDRALRAIDFVLANWMDIRTKYKREKDPYPDVGFLLTPMGQKEVLASGVWEEQREILRTYAAYGSEYDERPAELQAQYLAAREALKNAGISCSDFEKRCKTP